MFKQLESRTNKNSSFTLISIYFHLVYQHNIYLAAVNLVKLAKALNRSTLQKLSFSVTEYYLLELIMNNFKHHTKDEIDYRSFIESSQMQQRLDWLFEDASQEIIQFWRLFKEEQANVQRAYHLAMNISNNIALIRDYTAQLEEKQLIKDYNKYYYYAMFYQNLLNDRQSYNQMINNLRNMLMVRNIQKKNSRFGMTTQNINDIGFAIFSIEDGGASDKSVGKFIYCNKSCCNILNISEEDVLGKSAVHIMPELIRQNHDLFVKRFNQDGLTRNIGKVRNAYIKDFNGYIKPVQFFINFYYTSKFSYTFIMHLDPIQSINYYGTSSQINMKHCMVILCDQDNTIQNMTENVRRLIGLTQKRVKEEEEILGRGLKIEDLIFHYQKLENTIQINKISYLPNQTVRVKNFRADLFAGSTSGFGGKVQLNYISDSSFISCSMIYEEVQYLRNSPGQFSEKVYVLIPISKVPELDNASSAGLNSQVLTQNAGGPDNQSAEYINGGTQSRTSTDDMNNNLSPSCSSIASSSSMGSSSGIASTKNLLFQQKSPKILNLYLSIVFGVFLSFMIITSINFAIYIQKKNEVNTQIQLSQIINERNIALTTSILDLMQLHLMTQKNPQYPLKMNNSNIFPYPDNTDRFGTYSDMILVAQEKLIDNHQKFKKMGQSQAFLSRPEFNSIKYKMVSNMGRPYVQNDTLDFGIQLLISNLAMMKPEYLFENILPVNMEDYIAKLPPNSTLTQLSKSLYYIYTNGLSTINYLISLQSTLILENTLSNASDSTLFINLISFISIGMITFIGIFTFPMLGKIEDRKISVLKFFNFLSVEQIVTLIKKGEEYRVEFQSLQRNVNSNRDDDVDEQEESGTGNNGESVDRPLREYGMYDTSTLSQPLDTSQIDITFKLGKGLKQVKGGKSSIIKSGDKKGGTHSSITQLGQSKKGVSIASKPDEIIGKQKGFQPQQKHQRAADMKKNVSNKTAAEGIKSIFKKIRENEENYKEGQQITKKKTTKLQTANLQSAFDDNQQKKYSKRFNGSKKIEEELKEGDGGKYHARKAKQRNLENEKIRKGQSHNNSHHKRSKSKIDMPSSQEEDEEDKESDDDDMNEKNGYHPDKKSNTSNDSIDERSKNSAIESANNRTNHINQQLEKVALTEKLKLALYVVGVLIFLNSCLIACFSIGQKTFSEEGDAVQSITTFYDRQFNLNNLMVFTMHQYLQNKSVYIEGFDKSDIVTYYTQNSQIHEQEYNDIRKDLPNFLKNVQTQVDALESSDMCKTIFKSSDVQKIANCENVYDEIMKRGLTYTLYTIFNYAQSVNVRFNRENRTANFQNNFIYNDQKMRDLTDLVNSYINDAFVFVQKLVTDQAVVYFNQLGSYYMIVYGIYMGLSILMCLIFGLFFFKQIRQEIITSANILAIMPLEELDNKDRQKIEVFLNS